MCNFRNSLYIRTTLAASYDTLGVEWLTVTVFLICCYTEKYKCNCLISITSP